MREQNIERLAQKRKERDIGNSIFFISIIICILDNYDEAFVTLLHMNVFINIHLSIQYLYILGNPKEIQIQ